MNRGHSVKKEQHPKETANVLSLLSFFYTLKLFIKGYRKTLHVDDLYEVLKGCCSQRLGDQLEDVWQKQRKRGKTSIVWTLWCCYGKLFLSFGFLQFVRRIVTTIWAPYSLSKLISFFNPGQTDLTTNDAIYYASIVIGLNFVNMFFYHNYTLALIELGIRIRTAVCSLLFRKVLKLNSDSLSGATVGKIITIMTKDIDAFELFFFFGNDIWIGFVQATIICYLIYSKIGFISLLGISFFFIVLPVQVLLGKCTYTFRLKSSQITDERLELTKETLTAIKIIKMYTWERYFVKRVDDARKKELKELHKLFYAKIFILIIGGLCSKVAFFLFMMTYVWTGNSVTAETVFYIMSCFNDMQFTLSTLIPFGLSYGAELYATAMRIEDILHAKEISPAIQQGKADCNPRISFSGVSAKIGGRIIFKNVSLKIKPGLNVVVGPLGSGKTSLLKTILQDLEVEGDLKVNGTISYASQEPWLFPSSIRNNIVFGEKFCQKRYEKVVEICCLNYDLALLVDGDGTIVGDHGINLSKGQQARVNLARAIYKDSDIYLLDDCLAALDAHVSNNIFMECFEEFLKNKLCIFVTNNFEHIKRAKTVIVVDNEAVYYDEKLTKNHQIESEKIYATESEIIDELPGDQTTKQENIYHEASRSGTVDLKVYRSYIASGGGLVVFFIVLVIFIISQVSTNYGDKLVSDWVTLEQNWTNIQVNSTKLKEDVYEDRTFMLKIYTCTVVATIILAVIKSFAFFNFTRVASVKLHKTMVEHIINAEMQFFDSNLIGIILNRFSKDLLNVDEYLPFLLYECLTLVFVAGGGVVLLTTINTVYLIEALILFAISCVLKMLYQPTGRGLQRLNATTRSPMIGYLNCTLEGLTTIRASEAPKIIQDEFDRHQNLYTSANYILNNSAVALAFALDFLCAIFTTLVIIQFLITDLITSVGDVGLAITQAFVISEIISSGITNLTNLENQMTLVERILEYSQLPQEEKGGQLTINWPQSGTVQFHHVSLKYQKNTAKHMLNNVSFLIESTKKLGIVGRTGAGKSSIISSLFRLYSTEGQITIDGCDITTVPLQVLRSNLAVIPQDPFFFTGTIRDNLDPFGQSTDAEIWRIIDQLKLKTAVSNLQSLVNKDSRFSAGQKQLLCLARAVLSRARIVVLDEATANVDQETDSLIHDTIRRSFAQSTVIIIAHRLLSVLNCDKVAVLNRGRIVEFGKPTDLLANKNSFMHCVLK